MPSLHPGFEYDIFISYRQNDNRSGWVRQFVEDLREELGATLKDQVNIYYDENPHDGLQDTHLVDESLKGKLNCLIFIPILSRTYCDPKGFAWNHEFLPFCRLAREDTLGLVVRLTNGNATSRVLPVLVHDIDGGDKQLFENEIGSVLRPLDFVFRGVGVNRPLDPADTRAENVSKTIYRDQLNKAANAIREIIDGVSIGIPADQPLPGSTAHSPSVPQPRGLKWFWAELLRRNVFRAAITYFIVGLLLLQVLASLAPKLHLTDDFILATTKILMAGFPLAIILAWLFEASPEGWIRTASVKSMENPFHPSRKKPLTSPGVLLTLIVLLVCQYLFFKYFDINRDSRKSIAVLNFVDQSEDKKDAFFAEALTNDIIDRLCRIPELRVISPLSSSTYKNSNASILTIALELDVAYILSGTIRRNGELTIISVRLTDGRGTVKWSHPYEKTGSEILDIHSDIAINVSRILEIDLEAPELELLNRNPTLNLTAWDYYQNGIRLYTQHRTDSIDVAIEQFKKAIALDPNYSLAWSGLADAYSQLPFRAARGMQWLDSSRAAARRAIKLDTNSAEAYKALSNSYFYSKQYDSSYVLLSKAVEKNPKNVPSTFNLGTVYLVKADLVAALNLMKKAASLSPLSAIPFQGTGWTYRLLGEMGKAEEWLILSLDRNPSLWDTYRELGFTYCFDGKPQKALELVPKVLELGKRDARTLEIAGRIALFAGDRTNAKDYFLESIQKNPNYNTDASSQSSIGLGAIFLNEGDKVQAEVYLTQALNLNLEQIDKGVKDDDPPYNAAAIFALQGKKDEALKWLHKAIEYHWVDYKQVERGPYFAKLAGDPDLAQLLKRVQSKVDSMRKSIPKN